MNCGAPGLSTRGKTWNCSLIPVATSRGAHRLPVGSIVVAVVVMTVMVMAVYNDHHLRLRRVGHCEAEDQGESEQDSFHSSVSGEASLFTELL